MVLRLIIRYAVWVAALAALLFVLAGTVAWPGVWVFLAEMAGGMFTIGFWLAKNDPALLAARLDPIVQRGQARWDKVLMAGYFMAWIAWTIFMALDAVRYRFSHVPGWAQAIGAVAVPASIYVIFLTFRANSYAARVVKIQKERGHAVVATGPYRYVRHPMYAGAILTFLGAPLLLGSWYGLALAPVLIALFAVRAVMEERTLARELDGYAQYAARVRYRFIPLIW